MRTIIVVIYVFLFLILGLPVLGIEWIIAKFDKHAADISQLRIVQWGLRCVSFLAGVHLTVEGKNMYQRIRLYFILEITAAFLILSLLMHSVRI